MDAPYKYAFDCDFESNIHDFRANVWLSASNQFQSLSTKVVVLMNLKKKKIEELMNEKCCENGCDVNGCICFATF